MASRLAVSLCGIPLRNPVLAASGTFGYGVEFADVTDLTAIGGIVVKGLSREPIEGNAPPRLWETHGGMVNSIGLQNIGVRRFINEKLPELRKIPTPVFANVFGYQVADYVETATVLESAEGVAAYELNVSCPNTEEGGMWFGANPLSLSHLVTEVRKVCKRPLIVKLSPNVTRIEVLAMAAAEAGADAISLVNTFVALAIDARTRKPRLGAAIGGLSGPAIKPIALRLVYEAAQSVKIPVVGLGGIATGEDAAEFMIAGATAVEVGTASFWDPGAVARIARELDQFLYEQSIPNAANLTGSLEWKRGS